MLEGLVVLYAKTLQSGDSTNFILCRTFICGKDSVENFKLELSLFAFDCYSNGKDINSLPPKLEVWV